MRKSSSEKRAFRIAKNINREVIEENKANAFDTTNTMNVLSDKNIGIPLSWFPP
ncbi:hypothetical protein A2U01_0115148, partial [Trifolium medium]|nr:hypothetical protein [Trifolium medium]